MCGRFALSMSPGDLVEEFKITMGFDGPALPANWNVTPTSPVYAIRDLPESPGGCARELFTPSWGLIAPWSKDQASALKSQSNAINARIESVHEKPTFRSAFRSRRCIIPVTGYYEWATENGPFAPKQPFYIHAHNPGETEQPLALAGIFDRWVDSNGEIHESCSIITRPALGQLAAIHHRMPTFITEERWTEWLSPEVQESDHLHELLEFSAGAEGDDGDDARGGADMGAGTASRTISVVSSLSAVPVSTRVNYTRNNGPELIVPELSPSQPSLFGE
jgi:putative SOS response-associated peptidase YedK